MPHPTLADFLESLEDAGDIVSVATKVQLKDEIAEITRRVGTSGPALLFKKVEGSDIPLVSNLLATPGRLCRALGVASLEEVADRVRRLIQPELPHGWIESLKMVPHYSALAKLPPKNIDSGPCQQIVHLGNDVDLGRLPIPTLGQEAQPVLYGAQVFTRGPQTGKRNVGSCPLAVLGRDGLAPAWEPHQGIARHWQHHLRTGQPMPVAVTIGGDPIYRFMAAAPVPPEIDECLLGGFLRDRPIELVSCRTIGLEVPSDVEIVLEGEIDPRGEAVEVGPFALPTGHLSLPQRLPKLQVTAITHRSNPILVASLQHHPPHEGTVLAQSMLKVFLPLLKMQIPELVDCALPDFGGPHTFACFSIRKSYPFQAHKVASSVWGCDPFLLSKLLVIVDEHVNVHDPGEVLFHVGANVHPARDVLFHKGPTSIADHAAPQATQGEKMALDATAKLPTEHPRPWPEEVRPTSEVEEMVASRWKKYGLPPLP